MIATEINILPFYTSLSLQHHQKWYAYGQYYCMPTPAGFLVPFQLRRENTGAAISSMVVVEVSTGTETNVLASAVVSGLEVVEYAADGYDLIIYPSTVSLGSFNVGRHYIRMGDGTNTWYSEVFNFVDTTAGLVKIEWWHSGDFCYPSGHVRYNYPYKGRVYLKTDIGKPEYTFEQVVSERNGKNFKLKQISAKQYKFVFLAPEYLIDAFRQIPLHDYVEITNYNDNRIHTIDEINMGNPDWQDRGDLAGVTVDFQTDTVIVKSGSGVTTLDYTPVDGECLPVDYVCVGEVGSFSTPYFGFYYIRESDGVYVNFAIDDLILITDSVDPFERRLFEFNGGYALQTVASKDVAYDTNTGTYYFYDTTDGSFIRPIIDDITAGVVTGRTFAGTLAAIYGRTGATSTLLTTVTAAQLELGVSVTIPGGTDFVYFVVQTAACPSIVESSPYYIMTVDPIGVGYDVVETDLIVY